MGIFTVLAAAASVGVWTFQLLVSPVRGEAIPEFLSSIAFSLWSIVLSVRLLRHTSFPKS